MATPVRRKRLILDIGSSAVRMCELSKAKTGYQLTKYHQLEFNVDPALSDDERKENRVRTIQQLLKETKVRTKKTIFGVPGQSVFTRTRPLPPVPEYKVSQIVRYEIQQQIPFSLDQIAMDYQILDRTSAGGYEVMMAAIKVDVVDKQVELLQATKRAVDTVDVSPLAAYNWLKKAGSFGTGNDCVAMIDLGATTTDIVIEREGQFRFTRPLNVGGNDITKAVSAAFGFNFADAERAKRERGFAPTGDPAKDGKAGEVIGQVLQRLVSEIMRSFAFFRSQPGGGQVNRVVLCGGGARMRNIVPYLQSRLGVEVKIADALGGIQIGAGAKSVTECPEQACVALGLALRCLEPVPIEINLIPPRILEAIRIKEQAFYWILILLTLGLTFASVIPVKAKQNELDNARIEEIRRNIRMYDPAAAATGSSKKVSQFSTLKTQVTNLKGHIQTLDEARSKRKFWLDELKLVSDARPSGGTIVITAFESANVKASQNQNQNQTQTQDPRALIASRGMPPMPGGPATTNADGSNAAGAIVSGFPGINGQGAESLGGGGSSRMMGIGMGMEGGGMGMPMGGRGMPGVGGATNFSANTSVEALTLVKIDELPVQNGITINGLAESDILLQEYVEALRNAKLVLYNRNVLSVTKVFFAEATVQELGQNAVMNFTSATQGGGVGPNYNGKKWYSFQINLRVKTQTPAEVAAAAAAAANNPQGATGI